MREALDMREDAAHQSGDKGVQVLTVRQDDAAALASANGEYQPLITDANGRLHVNVGDGVAIESFTIETLNVDNVAAAQDGTWTVGIDGVVNVLDNDGSLSVDDDGGSLTVDDGDGSLSVDDGDGSLTVDGAVTVAVDYNGSPIALLVDTDGALSVALANWPPVVTTATVMAADDYDTPVDESAQYDSDPVIVPDGYKGVRLYYDVSAINFGTGSVFFTIAAQDPVSENWAGIYGGTDTTITSVSTRAVTIYPGVAENGHIGRSFKVAVLLAANSTATFSVGAEFLP